ncbi:MAG: DUF4249 domain-containing protein [Bacteroidetes bacterium]|nr:DUF4249 domain-containing protein [Bacteroidota bacterium]
MKYLFRITYLFFAIVLFSACEDVIKVNVDPGPERLIVDAFVNNLPEKQVIRLTKSIPYFAKSGSEPGVEGATVAIVDTTNGGLKIFNFSDSGNGNYIFKPNAITGDTFTVDHNYVLIVVEGGDTLISLSRMQPTAPIDSLHITAEDGNTVGFKKGNYVELKANDLKGYGNTYWIKTFVNDTFRNRVFDINLAYDMTQTPNNQDGGEFIWPIRYGAINDFGNPGKTGTKVRVEIHSITLETYYYLNLIISENQNGGLFATPPTNIGSNIFNFNQQKKRAVGGFFNVAAVSRKEVTLP